MDLMCSVYSLGYMFTVTCSRKEKVEMLRNAVASVLGVRSFNLTLRLARKDNQWLRVDDDTKALLRGPIDPEYEEMLVPWKMSKYFVSDVDLGEEVIHVLVELPARVRSVSAPSVEAKKAPPEYVIWRGSKGSPSAGKDGVDLANKKTLPRDPLTTEVIKRLDQCHVVLMKSPPMTGKTSLAALVSHKLVNRSLEYNKGLAPDSQKKEKTLVASFSMLGVAVDKTFEEGFNQKCEMEWSDTFLWASQGYTVYLVVDETQMLYKRDGCDSPRKNTSTFWGLVKDLLGNKTLNIRVLMFASYGSTVQYSRLETLAEIPSDFVLGITQLNFKMEEIQEYVKNWFKGFECLQEDAEFFCLQLAVLTGCHVGLCVAAIGRLNELYESHDKSLNVHRSAEEWIRLVEHDSLHQDNDGVLIEALNKTRAMGVVSNLNSAELKVLKRLIYGERINPDDDEVKKCIRIGILVDTFGENIMFASTAMWRHIVKKFVGQIERAQYALDTLEEMIVRVILAIKYDNVRDTLGTTGIPLERAWQMEFYQACYRCTPENAFVTSADIGAIFGSPGCIDFTVHSGDMFWGIELLREGDRLDGHIEHFSPGGTYSLLQLTDSCLVDFRRVASVDDATVESRNIAADLQKCSKLFVVCYDADLAHVRLLKGESSWVIR